ncbi:MAG: ISL3 family transposase [Planctomycetes bacterium]|nr:ISL3 family transposase [Planctomycetota bacterium]
MSTTLLYHGFGIRGRYEYVRTEYVPGGIILSLRQRREHLRCAHCGSAEVHVKTHQHRIYRSVPIGSRAVTIHFPVPRVECQRCGLSRQVRVNFARERVTYTKSFERYVLELSAFMTIQDVAHHLQVSWDLVKGIQKRYLKKKFSRPRLRHVRQIAIDEIHIGRSGFATVVLDLERGAVVFVGPGRGVEAVRPFWRRLRSSRAQIRAVATDMAPGYIAAVREFLPDAVHVFDRFHVVKLFNEKLSEFRREMYRTLPDELQKKVLKGVRWLLLKNPENLDDDKNERRRLEMALQLNQPLATVYYMKERLRYLWEQPTKKAAQKWLDDWLRTADNSGIRMLKQFARTLAAHRQGLLAWYDFPISTGPLEATNNKIQLLKRQAFGYRDTEFFHLKIYALHLAKYALAG